MTYHVKDSADSIESNYSYVFNVCGNVGHPPDPSCVGSPAPAYQVSETESSCTRLGNSPSDVIWSLLDAANPTRGIAMTYMGGDPCGNTNLDRQLTISFLCSTEQGMSEFSHQRVIEDHCHYKLTVSTVFGCPNECHVGANRQLCSGHGFCGMDADRSKPRCFCYANFYGEACNVETNGDNMGFLGVVLILTILLLTGLLIAAVYTYIKVGRLHRVTLYQMEEVGDGKNSSRSVFTVDDTSDL
jgi:hypothetical protein